MVYEVEYDPAAVRDLKRLPEPERKRIVVAIEKLTVTPRPQKVKKLAGSIYYRIRVGDYRVIYDIKADELVVLIVRVRHRRDVYGT